LGEFTHIRCVAVSDVKANDQVIQQLKDAMMEQEDTMEKQDAVISHKDEQIKSLTSGTASHDQGSDFENNET